MTTNPQAIFWFRRDLRLEDNTGLWEALRDNTSVLPVFIFDRNILNQLETKADDRVSFIYAELQKINEELTKIGSGLLVVYGDPLEEISKIIDRYPTIKSIYFNSDYEPYARKRDQEIAQFALSKKIKTFEFKDSVIFHKDEVLKENNEPYSVFTPYKNRWLKRFDDQAIILKDSEKHKASFFKGVLPDLPTIEEIGFENSSRVYPAKEAPVDIIRSYDKTRDYPALSGTSKLSIHLRFGTVSIRQLVAIAFKENATWLNELIWRDFYQMIIWHFPYSATRPFKAAYNNIPWRNNEDEFHKWCLGQTGYPIVDAGMRELNATGFMHNRLRMITASFLTKHLLIDWRWGEAYFASKLLDYDLASNVGGWQWAASCGCDAVPYFRIFNPTLQMEKFDKNLEYVQKWVPDYKTASYPNPIVEHSFARNRAIETYKSALTDNH